MVKVRLITDLLEVPDVERNLCLIAEVPMLGYVDVYKGAPNPTVAINPVCWKYVSDIHIVMPNVKQLYVFKTLEHKHYHYDKDDLITAIKSTKLPIKIHIHKPGENVLHSAFVKVINKDFDEKTQATIDSIPLLKIASSLHKETITGSTKTKKRSHYDASNTTRMLALLLECA